MELKTILAVMLVIAAVGVATQAISAGVAHAQNGVPFEKNFGQCKQDKNTQACKEVVKPGNG